VISVLIPWRSDDPARVEAWAYLRGLWAQADVELCSTSDGLDGRFSYAAGANRCRTLATGEHLLLYGADQLPPTPGKLDWIRQRLKAMPWTGVYAETRVYSRRATRKIMDGLPLSALRNMFATAPVAEGIIAVRADVFDDLRGMDERFRGWGAEDVAFRFALKTLHPSGELAGEGISHTLFHEPQPWDELTTANNQLFVKYQLAAAAGRLREFLQEVGRA
jgi:hypothetical protein